MSGWQFGPEISLFMDNKAFSVIFKVFIKIHENANLKICITHYWMNGLYLSFKMRPISVGLG